MLALVFLVLRSMLVAAQEEAPADYCWGEVR